MKPFPEASQARPAASWIPPVLRPRFTWRYVACSLAISYVLYSFVTSRHLLAHPLPQYSGPHSVGAIDVEASAPSPRLVDPARFKATNENAFELRTVLFTLYYPASKGEKILQHHHDWIPKPVSVTAAGYAKFAHIGNFLTNALFTGAIKLLVGNIKIPAGIDLPLLDDKHVPLDTASSSSESSGILPGDDDEAEKILLSRVGHTTHQGYPVVVFSHGMASSRTDYTHYAGELASRGYVVAMLEHRDGSSPGTIIQEAGRPDETRLTFRMSEVESVEGHDLQEEDFKKAQLDFRQAEIEETVRVLQRINSGDGADVFAANPRREGAHLHDWADRLNTDGMIVAGHSYGATGAMQALKGGPSNELRPFRGAIILDPGKQSGRLNDDIDVPILVVHSNSWSKKRSMFYGRAHFDTVRDIVMANNMGDGEEKEDGGNQSHASWFMTSLGTSHPSVTDAPLLEPLLLSVTTGAKIDVHEALRQYVHISEDFLKFLADGKKRNLLAEPAEFPEYDPGRGFGAWKPGQGDDNSKRKGGEWADWRKYWQVHVAPA
ncbi:hypothetical protein PG990_005576 [Apiospora arundinis]